LFGQALSAGSPPRVVLSVVSVVRMVSLERTSPGVRWCSPWSSRCATKPAARS